MTGQKSWYSSKTIWASLVALLFPIASFLGLATDHIGPQSLVEGLMQLAAAAGGLVAIIGRMKATSRIS